MSLTPSKHLQYLLVSSRFRFHFRIPGFPYARRWHVFYLVSGQGIPRMLQGKLLVLYRIFVIIYILVLWCTFSINLFSYIIPCCWITDFQFHFPLCTYCLPILYKSSLRMSTGYQQPLVHIYMGDPKTRNHGMEEWRNGGK